MKTGTWILAGAMAAALGLGMSTATSEAAGIPACERFCRTEYTQCWYACTPGNGACYTQCQQNYYDCVADMCG